MPPAGSPKAVEIRDAPLWCSLNNWGVVWPCFGSNYFSLGKTALHGEGGYSASYYLDDNETGRAREGPARGARLDRARGDLRGGSTWLCASRGGRVADGDDDGAQAGGPALALAMRIDAKRSRGPVALPPGESKERLDNAVEALATALKHCPAYCALGEDVTPMWTISRRAKSTMTKQYRIWNRSVTMVRNRTPRFDGDGCGQRWANSAHGCEAGAAVDTWRRSVAILCSQAFQDERNQPRTRGVR
jgi:hypothetical protein